MEYGGCCIWITNNNIHSVGSGIGSTIIRGKHHSIDSVPMFWMGASDNSKFANNISFENMTLDGQWAGISDSYAIGTLLDFAATTNALVRNCALLNSGEHGIDPENNISADIVIDGCTFSNTATAAVHGNASPNSTRFLITNSRFTRCSLAGYIPALYYSGSSSYSPGAIDQGWARMSIENCVFDNNPIGVAIQSGSMKVRNCYFVGGSSTTNIWVQGSSFTPYPAWQISGCTLEGTYGVPTILVSTNKNTGHDATFGIISGNVISGRVLIESGNSICIIGNYLSSDGEPCIELRNAEFCSVMANHAFPGTYLVRMQDGFSAFANTVSGNTVVGSGVYLGDQSTGNVIDENNVSCQTNVTAFSVGAGFNKILRNNFGGMLVLYYAGQTTIENNTGYGTEVDGSTITGNVLRFNNFTAPLSGTITTQSGGAYMSYVRDWTWQGNIGPLAVYNNTGLGLGPVSTGPSFSSLGTNGFQLWNSNGIIYMAVGLTTGTVTNKILFQP
jgi:hypothetical protein